MNFLWVDEGNDPDWQVVRDQGIDGLYFAVRDPRLTPAYITSIKSHGVAVGVYAAWNWAEFAQLTGVQFAEAVADLVKNHIAKGVLKPNFPKVQFNIETHDPAYILTCLTRWRELMPNQDTSWTMEGMQGGWMTKVFVEALIRLRIRVVPQCYNGAMTEAWDAWVVARDLLRRGFPESLISPFYDAKRLPLRWDGFAFTMGRLPR